MLAAATGRKRVALMRSGPILARDETSWRSTVSTGNGVLSWDETNQGCEVAGPSRKRSNCQAPQPRRAQVSAVLRRRLRYGDGCPRGNCLVTQVTQRVQLRRRAVSSDRRGSPYFPNGSFTVEPGHNYWLPDPYDTFPQAENLGSQSAPRARNDRKAAINRQHYALLNECFCLVLETFPEPSAASDEHYPKAIIGDFQP